MGSEKKQNLYIALKIQRLRLIKNIQIGPIQIQQYYENQATPRGGTKGRGRVKERR
jgi:hypothetical protein